jgi:hypothetical protein
MVFRASLWRGARHAIRILSDGNEESFDKDERYPLRERQPRGEWWKNHILFQPEQECANVVFVDDPLNLCEAMRSEDASKWEFEMSDLGELNYCLGVQFQRDRKTHTIIMSQTSYIEEVLRGFNMKDCKPVVTPSDANSKLLELSDEEFGNVQMEMEGVPYKAAVGSLM